MRVWALIALAVGAISTSPACGDDRERRALAYCRDLVVDIATARDSLATLKEHSFATMVSLMTSDRMVFCASLDEDREVHDPDVQRYRALTTMLNEIATAHWMRSDLGRSVTASYPAVERILEQMENIARSVAGSL